MMNETTDGLTGLMSIDIVTLCTVMLTALVQLYDIYERKSHKLECGKNCCCDYFLYETDDSDTDAQPQVGRKHSVSNV